MVFVTIIADKMPF